MSTVLKGSPHQQGVPVEAEYAFGSSGDWDGEEDPFHAIATYFVQLQMVMIRFNSIVGDCKTSNSKYLLQPLEL